MRITLRVSAYTIDESSGELVPTPPSVAGWQLSADSLENYLDLPLVDQGVVGGEIRAVCDGQSAQLLVDYWMPGRPDPEAIAALEEFTRGQLSDGMGEGGFAIEADDRAVLLLADTAAPIGVEVVDDGRDVAPPSPVAIAARDGNFAALKAALEAGEPIDGSLQGYTPLHWAILYGHVDAALLLIAKGADPSRQDFLGNSPLDLCAVSNSLSDDDSAKVATALVEKGADLRHIGPTGETPIELARIRGKKVLAACLARRN